MASILAAAEIIRRSVSLPVELAEKIDAIAASGQLSSSAAA
jgi:hypothetical protein